MRNIFLALPLMLVCQLGFTQVQDGIYSFNEMNAYLIHLTRGDTTRAYIFSLGGQWRTMHGSVVGDTVELADLQEDKLFGIKLSGVPAGLSIESLYCINYPAMDSEGCGGLPPLATPIYKATDGLKAVYRTQWGSEIAVFESNDTVLVFTFDLGEIATDRLGIAASTASKTDNLLIRDLTSVYESNPNSVVKIKYDLQISSSQNPQAEFVNFTCEALEGADPQACVGMKDTLFSKLIRVF